MIDVYFRRPVFWDLFIAGVITAIAILLAMRGTFTIPSAEHLYSIVSDLATISLTLAGFVLTLLTVLISFKSSVRKIKGRLSEKDTVFEAFFSTGLYFHTTRHLRNAVVSLTLVAASGYFLKLTMTSNVQTILFCFNSVGAIVVLLTLWRCLTILSQIIRFQKSND